MALSFSSQVDYDKTDPSVEPLQWGYSSHVTIILAIGSIIGPVRGTRAQPPAEQRTYDDWAGDKINKLVPVGRWQGPEDMAAMAVFLASEHAKNVTGQTVNVDGGFVTHW